MSSTRRSQVNALVLNLLLAAVGTWYFSARKALASLPAQSVRHLDMGGGTFPSREVLPWVEVEILYLCLWLVGALLALEMLPLLLPASRRPRAWVIGLGQVLLVLGLTLNAELVLRQILWPLRGDTFLAPHATRYWTFNRYTTDNRFTVNRHGLRGVEINPHRQPNEFRILCLGNSISAGDNLKENQTYPFLLQAYLRKHCPGTLVRVQNGAVYGYSCLQGVMVYEDVADEFKPDLVIVGMSYFDVGLVDRNGEPFLSHRWPLNELRAMAFESMLYMTLRQAALTHQARSAGPEPPDPRTARNSDDQLGLTAKSFRWLLEESKKRGFQLVLYTTYAHKQGQFMVPKEPTERPALRRLYRRMRQGGLAATVPEEPKALRLDDPTLSQEELAYLYDIPHVDLDRTWRMKPDIGKYMADSSHPNVAGTVMQAEDIGNFLLNHGLIPGCSHPTRTD